MTAAALLALIIENLTKDNEEKSSMAKGREA
jgi:hypothetical protein